MNDSRFMVDHVRRTTDKPFDDVAKAFEAQLGKFDGDVRKAATASEDAEEAKAKIAAMAGPSGFMLFSTSDHGALLRLAGPIFSLAGVLAGELVVTARVLSLSRNWMRVSCAV